MMLRTSCNKALRSARERIPSAPWVYVVYILVKEGTRLKKALILQHAADLAFCFICRTTMLACKAGNIKAEGGFITVGFNYWRDGPKNVDGVYQDGALLDCHLCGPQCSAEAAPPTGWIPVGNLQHLHHLLQDNDDDDEL
ncbi:hypothetical protein MAR_017740 [Mya arenaria]|uniref:Uncharacterized protein n=1 Tax=Mya arenaria TaxID=6604 RepID=A0ABY7EG29_MYAAR|nr:hypothetical protein MAR_017740 [Mya arenaria]